MNKVIIILSLLVLSGCVPEGAVSVRDNPIAYSAFQYVQNAWSDAGLDGETKHHCDADFLYFEVVSADEFFEQTGYYDKFAIPDCEMIHPGKCAYGVREPLGWGVRNSIIYIAEETPQELYPRLFFHEITHFFADCSREDPSGDANHSNEDFWSESGAFGLAVEACKEDFEAGLDVACP